MVGTGKTGRVNRAAVTDVDIVRAMKEANGQLTAREVAEKLNMAEGAFAGRMTKLRAGYAEARKIKPSIAELPTLKDGRKAKVSGMSLANRLIMMLGTHEEYINGLESEGKDETPEDIA